MPHTTIPTRKADPHLERIVRRKAASNSPSNRVTYGAAEFEDDVRDMLEALFPHSVLSGIRLFSPTVQGWFNNPAKSGQRNFSGVS